MVLHSCSVNAQPTEPIAPIPIVQEDPTIPPQEARNQFPEDIFAPPIDASEQHEAMQGGIAIGDVVHVNENTKYFESSDYDTGGADREGQFGRQLPPGDYRVEAFSALVGGEINQVERQPGETIDNLIARVAEDLGISQEEVKVRLHLTEVGDNEGEPVGWLDPGDVTPIEQNN